MVHEIRGPAPRGPNAAGADAGSSASGSASTARNGVQAGLSGRHGSQWSGADFERRRAMLERMIDARTEIGNGDEDGRPVEREADLADDGREDGFEQRSFAHAAVAPEPVGKAEGTSAAEDAPSLPPHTLRSFAAIERLVRDFRLRDPLLAAHAVSCRLDFGDALPITAALSGTARDMEIRFDVTAETFALRTGCPVGLMAEALRARFGDLRIRVVFAPPVDDGRKEDEA